jgi:alkyldihydroxyacetonephosphate synthase
VTDNRLWGWLSPDHADPLANVPLAESMLAGALGLSVLERTPPRPLDPSSLPACRLSKAGLAALATAMEGEAPSLDETDRAAASLGQSYPDQLARRAGRCETAADAVVWPASHTQAQALLDCASQKRFRVVAVGGATSVVGGLNPPDDKRPLVAANLSRLGAVLSHSIEDMTVTAEAGIRLAALEERLAKSGLTLGHFPQSFEGATLGGSIAAHGAGQRSDGYGRISERLLQARLATPSGEWRTEPVRHSAAGPWLGGLVAGSEGLFGLITEAIMAVSPIPETTFDTGWFFPSFGVALAAAREIAQNHVGASMVRISDEAETDFLSRFRLARAGRVAPSWAERTVLALKRAPGRPALLLAGFEGRRTGAASVMADLQRILRRIGGVSLGERPGRSWRRSRFEAPHLREALMARGLGVDTFETAAPWSRLADVHGKVRDALSSAIAATSAGKPGIVMCHLSHSYADAACLYFTAVFLRAAEPLEQWRAIKRAATQAMLAAGAAVSHHHGLGADNAPYAAAEKGETALRLIRALARQLDPDGVMASGASVLLAK